MNELNTNDPHKELALLILSYRFEEAREFINQHIKEPQIIRTLHYITEQETGLLSYAFINYVLQKEENSFWHKVASVISSESLDKIDKGHQTGLYHLLRAIELNPDDYLLKESALRFYNLQLLGKEKAMEFAQAVLQAEPENRQATRILQEAK